MYPDEVEEYENGNVALIIHRWNNPMTVQYYIRASVGLIQFKEDDFYDMIELLGEYNNEVMAPEPNMVDAIVSILNKLRGKK